MAHSLDDEDLPHHERELTLSTGAILGIFLGLAVLCGGFFGFGYNMGRKSAPTPLALNDVAPAVEPANDQSAAVIAKPPAGTPLEGASGNTTTAVATLKPVHHATPVPRDGEDGDTPVAETPVKRPPKPVPPSDTATQPAAPVVRQPPSTVASSPSATLGGTYMVQVAAVSHQEDANLLVSALRARGYAVSARSSAADSFIHVQVGPFHDKKEADAMRQRLLTDGYNAIVK